MDFIDVKMRRIWVSSSKEYKCLYMSNDLKKNLYLYIRWEERVQFSNGIFSKSVRDICR